MYESFVNANFLYKLIFTIEPKPWPVIERIFLNSISVLNHMAIDKNDISLLQDLWNNIDRTTELAFSNSVYELSS